MELMKKKCTPQIPQTPSEKYSLQKSQTVSDQFMHLLTSGLEKENSATLLRKSSTVLTILQTLFRKSVNEKKSETVSRISIIPQTLFANLSISMFYILALSDVVPNKISI